MNLPTYIKRRNATFYFVRRVPVAASANPAFGGREFYRKSLRTSDPVAAREAGLRELAWFDAVVAGKAPPALLVANDQPFSSGEIVPDEEMIGAIAREVYERGIRGWKARVLSAQGEAREHLDDEYELWAMDGQHVVAEAVASALARAERAHNLDVPHGSPERALLQSAIRTAVVDQFDGVDGMVRREELFPSPASTLIREAQATVNPRRRWTMRKVQDHLFENVGLGHSWRKKIVDAVNAWDGLGSSQIAILDVTNGQVVEYVRSLRQLPCNVTKRFPGVSYREAIALNRDLEEPYPVLSEKTIFEGYVSGIKKVIGHALDEGLIDRSPLARLPKRLESSVSARDRIFQRDELTSLFRHPIFVGCQSADRPNTPGPVLLNDHYFWAPLIALFTGARASEIAQLTVDRARCAVSVPHIEIAPLPGGRLKNKNAWRRIPIHPGLLDLGFAAFVEGQRKGGHNRLFPDWPMSTNKAQQYSSARVIRNFNEEVVPSVVKRDLPPTFHTLRANFKTELATVGVSVQFQNAVMGHAQSAEDPSYLGTLDLLASSREVAKMKFEGVEMEHLKPAARGRSKS
ncbi:MAG: site-specific integrase [Alphaproteobacteria bacterium]|nr:MAG: site-specific integrase [Alphaproteobacteria bacterium]